jgi:hypothetical protein
MRNLLQRKSAPGVRNGRVQPKNRWSETPDYDITPQARPFIDRQRPGAGYRHLLFKRDIERFLAILPNWEELSQGLNAIVLAPGQYNTLGWHRPGLVAVCAWPRKIVEFLGASIAEVDGSILDRLGVERTPLSDTGMVFCHFTEAQARGYQLLAVLLHELGHHHDRMTTRSRRCPSRGEPYAFQYAERHSAEIWDRYQKVFAW